MNGFIDLDIEGLWIYRPVVFQDDRGYFFESYQSALFEQKIPDTVFVQDNQAASGYGVVRGLHYQCGSAAQAKLVRVLTGKILDVAVDLRPDSPSYGQHQKVLLSAENQKQFFIPRGFAHGYISLSNYTVVLYKCDAYYSPQDEAGIRYDDPQLNIDWGLPSHLLKLSPKDLKLPNFKNHKPIE